MIDPTGMSPMAVDETKFSEEGKALLQIVRAEAEAHRITPAQREMLEDAVRLREAGVLARKGLLWFAGTIAALTTIWMAMQKMYELAAAYFKSRGM